MTADPPSFVGGVIVKVNDCDAATADPEIVGAPGMESGVPEVAADASPEPKVLTVRSLT